MIPAYVRSRRVSIANMIKETNSTRAPFLRALSWICLVLACVGAGWFAFQYFLVPQPQSYTPDWQQARWIQASDATAPVAYFRFTTTIDQLPDEAFITVAASQVFSVYVNGQNIGTNAGNFVKGNMPQTSMYDISMALQTGVNVVGLRVTNMDNQLPRVRANIGAVWGNSTRFIGTNGSWQATAQAGLAHPRQVKSANAWAQSGFSATLWPPARLASAYPADSPLLVNPAIYERPMPPYWLNAGSGAESYYVHQFTLTPGYEQVLLRILAVGKADIFINGHQAMHWNAQAEVPPQQNYAVYDQENDLLPVPYQKGLMLGVYDIAPYIHMGTNTLAIHVSAPGHSASQAGLEMYQGSLSTDLLVRTDNHQATLLDALDGWYAAKRPMANWMQGGAATASWLPPTAIGRPGTSQTFYLPGAVTSLSSEYISPSQWLSAVGDSVLAVLICWLVMGAFVLRRYYTSQREALMAAVLIFLPALACEALLIVLDNEPSIPLPFPYTTFWGCFLVALVLLSAVFCWWRIRTLYRLRQTMRNMQAMHALTAHESEPVYTARPVQMTPHTSAPPLWLQRCLPVLKRHWALFPLILIAIPMICYDLGYEPYWQDELSSYTAARGILAHGIPTLVSGALYPKGELFSYLMALAIAVLGSGQVVPRLISVVEYLACIPLLYFVGFSLFKKRSIAWLATALLALSPYTLLWGRQARMYEQALFMVTLTLYMFYRAMQARDRTRPLYLAILCLVLTYFSHEESFIILPAILFYALLGSREGPYGIPAVLRKKHWWLAAIIGGGIIAIQLTIVHFFHPIWLGSDQSTRPQIQLTADNIPFYFQLFFWPKAVKEAATPWADNPPWLTLNSILAIIGMLWACFSRDRAARYCALFLLVSLLTLVFLFTMQADRYFYPLLSVFYLLDAYAVYKILRGLWLLARPHLVASRSLLASNEYLTDRFAVPLWLVSRSVAACLCLCVVLLPMLPINSYNLFVSRVFGMPYHRHYPDYNNAGAYVRSHWQPGDIVVTISPAVSILYYVGQADYYFSVDRALFVIERGGLLHEVTSNSHPLLNRDDFQAVLSAHKRIWIISDNGLYQAGVMSNNRFGFPAPGFHIVYEGYGSAVYFRGS